MKWDNPLRPSHVYPSAVVISLALLRQSWYYRMLATHAPTLPACTVIRGAVPWQAASLLYVQFSDVRCHQREGTQHRNMSKWGIVTCKSAITTVVAAQQAVNTTLDFVFHLITLLYCKNAGKSVFSWQEIVNFVCTEAKSGEEKMIVFMPHSGHGLIFSLWS